ncbi:hypothetical protein MMC16_000221 [Acarospora aff. strigata]|nr:hypothetical protein [Acarospora aff. strigata]
MAVLYATSTTTSCMERLKSLQGRSSTTATSTLSASTETETLEASESKHPF